MLVSEASHDGFSYKNVLYIRQTAFMFLILLSSFALHSNGGTCISQSMEVCDCSTAVKDGYKYGMLTNTHVM